jgi:toxin ParE1/3/4
MGRDGVLSGTRELIVPGLPYIIVYRVAPEEVVVVGVYHGAQLRPGQSEL